MKKTIHSIVMLGLIFGSLISCKSNAEKQEDAVENVQEAQDDLNAVQVESQSDSIKAKGSKEQWEAFKQDVNATIAKNEQRIKELNEDIKKQGKKIDVSYQKNVDDLHEKNEDLRAKMKSYENDKKQDWESFRKEFNSDMSDLGNALKNFTLNNKN